MEKKIYETGPYFGMECYHDALSPETKVKINGMRESHVELISLETGKQLEFLLGDTWFPKSHIYRKRKECENKRATGNCNLPNVHCRWPDCEPFV